jgi:threonine synthase
MGLPINHFLACSNVNDTVPEYLATSEYNAKPSIQTVSNAMDVGDPSNFARMLDLFSNSHDQMTKSISGYSFTDQETREAIQTVYEETGYVLDPHGAVGYLGLKKHKNSGKSTGIFLETAHPYKFKQTVETEIGKKLTPVMEFENKEKKSIPFDPEFRALKELLLNR